jgi:hypothetical protein
MFQREQKNQQKSLNRSFSPFPGKHVDNPKGRCLKAGFNKAFSNTIPLQKKLGV